MQNYVVVEVKVRDIVQGRKITVVVCTRSKDCDANAKAHAEAMTVVVDIWSRNVGRSQTQPGSRFPILKIVGQGQATERRPGCAETF